MDRSNLVEIKKGQTGTGLLIEHEGYVSVECGDNKKLFEEIGNPQSNDFFCPDNFIVSAVFQKYGIENANGRIYPEGILKREVEKYQKMIKERTAMGECYRPEALILTESGWKHLYEVSVGENILTLNPETKIIEVKPIKKVIKHSHNGKMINIKGRNINDIVTPEHGYPIFDRFNNFKEFVTAQNILDSNKISHNYIPKQGHWEGLNTPNFIIPKIKQEDLSKNLSKKLKEKYSNDLIIPMEIFAKFMGIYLSEGCCDKNKASHRVQIFQKKENVVEEILKMLEEWDVDFSLNKRKNGCYVFVINDIRLCKYLSQFGNNCEKFVPFELKQQNKHILKLFYDWFVLGDGRIRGDKRRNGVNLSTDVFSTSEKLIMDLNEIQLKIGYSGTYSKDMHNNDRMVEGRLIKGENCMPMYFSYCSLTKGIYLDKRFIEATEIEYNGDVMCVEVENHIWYVMDNGKCHWTKNCNHPSESVIDLSRVAMNIIELHWEGHTLVGKLEIITSPGFRKYGIISCQGDQIANLILTGHKIGVSSRGLGSVTQRMGTLIVGDDFELVCWDIVSTPSTPGAWISENPEELSQYMEAKETDKPIISEKYEQLEKFKDWLNG